jgi:putative MATE family efflux protein
MDARTQALLEAPIGPTIVRLALPNVVVMVVQASIGLIETYFVGQLGTDALAGMALVFPGFMMMQMISAGALGGAISSAVARAIGAGRRDDADALVVHALVINLALGALFAAGVVAFGPQIYSALGGRGGSLSAALQYSNVVFAGVVLLWALNGLASVVRGTGNMLVPALVVCAGVIVLIPLSPVLIFGFGPVPAFGIAGGGFAILAINAAGAAFLAWYVASGRNLARFRRTRLRWAFFRDILAVGGVAMISTVQTNVVVLSTTALVGAFQGPAAVAGYGTGARLEYLLVPLVFGLGAPLVALVGTNIGAGNRARALRIAFTGGVISFVMTEAIGLVAALHPRAWLGLFGHDPAMLATGSAYLTAVGPFYGFFGLGLALYFASQGAGKLLWPLLAGFLRMLIAVGGGYLVLRITGSPAWLFAALAAGMLLYGIIVTAAVASGSWFRRPSRASLVPA